MMNYYRTAVAAPSKGPGCAECIAWARLKAERKLPTSGDTYCSACGAREADVSRRVKTAMRAERKA